LSISEALQLSKGQNRISVSKLTLKEMYSIGVKRVMVMYIVHIRSIEYVKKNSSHYVKVCTCILLYHNSHHYLFVIVVQSTLLFLCCALTVGESMS